MKKVFCSLLAILLCSLTGCGSMAQRDKEWQVFNPNEVSGVEESQPEVVKDLSTIQIPFVEGDSFHPYMAQSRYNRDICTLLYDSLVKLDPSFQPVNSLASSVTENGLTWTVQLRNDVTFTNQTPLTATDVTYSLSMAKAAGSHYEKSLANVASFAAQGNSTVVITLAKQDQNFANLLTFPIVKSGSTIESGFIGTGRFVLQQGEQNEKLLKHKDGHFTGESIVKTVELVSLPDSDTLNYSLKIGNIDLIFNEGDTETVINSADVTYVSMNRLVYLGTNCLSGNMVSPQLRQAVSHALSRDEIISTVYLSRGHVALTPFHPDFYRLKDSQPQSVYDKGKTAELLKTEGFTEQDSEGYFVKGGSRFTIRLAVNGDNESHLRLANEIVRQLKDAGIACTVIEDSYAGYKTRLTNGQYDLYIAEIKLGNNMDISPLLTPGATSGFGAGNIQSLLDAFTALSSGTQEYSAFLDAFRESYPFIPLVYRDGVLSQTKNLNADIIATEQDIFYNIHQW